MLQSLAAGAGGDGPAYVRNFVELAEALKVTRQTINGWKKFEDAPKPEANGLHDVAKWREFMRQRGLKGGEETPDLQQALKARKLLAEVEERELRLAVSLNPDSEIAHHLLGTALFQQQQLHAAEKEFREALRINASADNHYSLAACLMSLDRARSTPTPSPVAEEPIHG